MSAAETRPMQQPPTLEVAELHGFFVSWFQASVPRDAATWSRVERALAPDFLLVSPDGSRSERGPLLSTLEGLYGSRRGEPLSIHTEEMQVRWRQGPLTLVTYVERQRTSEGTTRRFSSAVLREDPQAPCGWSWVHVHETWIQPDAG